MRTVLMMLGASAALAMATPALAQEAATANSAAGEAAADQPVPDPERLAAAGRVVDRIWPVGTYRRIMESTMSSVTGMAEASVDTMDWPTSDDSKESRRAQHEARTGRPLSPAADEAEAVASIGATMADLTTTMIATFDRVEPGVRTALTRIYARRYSLGELNELDTFFATPTGSRYAADSITLMNDPEMMSAMMSVMDETLSAVLPGSTDAANDAAEAAATAAVAAAVADAAATKY